MSFDDVDWILIPREHAETPNHDDRIYREFYFAVDADGNLIRYPGGSVQANREREIVEWMIDKKGHPGVEVEYIDPVFIDTDQY